MSTKHSFRAFSSKNYSIFSIGYLSYMLSYQMMDVVVGWQIYEMTNSASALGYTGLALFLPVLLFTLPAGYVTDRFHHRTVLTFSVFVQLVAISFLTYISWAQLSYVYIFPILCLYGVGRAFASPARGAIMPELVPQHMLSNAVTWTSNLFQVATTAGPMLGGFLVAATGSYPLIYMLAAGGTLLFLFTIGFLKLAPSPKLETSQFNLHSILEGFRFVLKNDLILASITLDMFAVLLGGATALLPIYAKDILNIGSQGLGWLRAAPAIGAFTMGIAIAILPARWSPLRKSGRSLLVSVFLFGLATIVFGISKYFWLSFFALFLTGAFDNISVVIRMTLVQRETPKELRGRVSAVNYVFIGSSNELGAFESGMVASAFGPVASVVSGGIGSLLVVLAVSKKWKKLRELGSMI